MASAEKAFYSLTHTVTQNMESSSVNVLAPSQMHVLQRATRRTVP
jgi:hypothetical protein